jgi:methionyl-tRNA formyltransferase
MVSSFPITTIPLIARRGRIPYHPILRNSFASTSNIITTKMMTQQRTAISFTTLVSSSGINSKSGSTSTTATVSMHLSQRKVEMDAEGRSMKRIVFLGSPPVAAESLRFIYEASQQPNSMFDVVAVITQPAKRGKRGAAEETAVSKMAQQLSIPIILTPDKANDPTFLDRLVAPDICPDLCITAAYGQYLPKKFLATPKLGTVNIHPSLLPRWRGASPVQRSLEAGDNPVGVTVLYTVSQMDAGPIIAQSSLQIDDDETATTLLPKLFQIGTQALINVLPDILNGNITMETATPQNEADVTHATLIDNAQAEFKVWQESATTCHNRLRGFHMWPKAYMFLQIGTTHADSTVVEHTPPIKLKVHEARVVPGLILPPTNVIQLGPHKQSGLYVVCFDGSVLELVTIQPPSKTAFPARDLFHGYPNAEIRWVPPFQEEEEEADIQRTTITEKSTEAITSRTV